MIDLSARETEIRDMICTGKTSKEVAQALQISPRTVDVHRDHIRKKYGARNTVELVRMVMIGPAGFANEPDMGQ